MLNEQIKKEAIELTNSTKDMIIPVILISPITTATSDEWKKIFYAFLDLKEAIQNKICIPISLAAVEGNDLNAEILDSMGLEILGSLGVDDVVEDDQMPE